MNNRIKWSEAATKAFILSIVTVVYEIIGVIFPTMPGMIAGLLSLLKLVVIIIMLRKMMAKDAIDRAPLSYGGTFRYGLAVCFFSSLICAAVITLLYTVVVPDIAEQLVETTFMVLEQSNIETMLDYNELSSGIFKYILFSKFFSCIISGMIISAILAFGTKTLNSDNPFDDGE